MRLIKRLEENKVLGSKQTFLDEDFGIVLPKYKFRKRKLKKTKQTTLF